MSIDSHTQRLIELLNDAISFATNSGVATTRISRAEDAINRVIPQLRQQPHYDIPYLNQAEAFFYSILRAAEVSELFAKGCAAKQSKASDRHFLNAFNVMLRNRTTDTDLVAIGAQDPRTGQPLTLAMVHLAAKGNGGAYSNSVAINNQSTRLRNGVDLSDLLRRDHSLNGGIIFGLDGYIVEIQARAIDVVGNSIPWRNAVTISGMARGAIREVMDRIVGAFAKFEVPDPQVSIMVNLAPADLPKSGTWLDLPLAIILLQASGYLPDLPEYKEGDFILMGELGLHGEIRRVPGALSLAYVAKPGQSLIVPTGNEKECALILAKAGHEGCRVYPVSTLDEVIEFFKGKRVLENALKQAISFDNAIEKAIDFGQIRGQSKAKQAALIAAAGGHNLLLIGPPGEGKSLLASAIPGILPRLTNDEKVQLTRIYSACGKLERDGMAVTRRPMRVVHHTASQNSVIGGGANLPRPGEITLAHLGVLFLDEIAEFPRGILEALRQPIESGEIHISRVGGTLTFPCRFSLIAAMNPCPCGYFGTERCICRTIDVTKYQKRISGPILDRIDLQVQLDRLTTEERFAETSSDVSPKLRANVERARNRQVVRFDGKDIACNAAIPGGRVRDYCDFSNAGLQYFKETIDNNDLTTRSMDRLAKVARTIADLNDKDQIESPHIELAATFVIGGMLRENFQE